MIFEQLPYIPKTLKDHKQFEGPIKIVTEKKILEAWPELRAFMVENLTGLVDNIISPDSTIEQILKWSSSPENKEAINKALIMASLELNSNNLNTLLALGADANYTCLMTNDNHISSWTPLIAIIMGTGRNEKALPILQSLLNSGANINFASEDGRTALMYAAVNNYSEILQTLLLDKNLDINAADINGNTALMMHTANSYELNNEIAKALIARGADVNVANINGFTALMIAATNQELTFPKAEEIFKSESVIAARKEQIEFLNTLLDAGANIDAANNLLTIHKILLALGDYLLYGDTALTYAAKAGLTHVVSLLSERGAKIPEDLEDYSDEIRIVLEKAKETRLKIKNQNKEETQKRVPSDINKKDSSCTIS